MDNMVLKFLVNNITLLVVLIKETEEMEEMATMEEETIKRPGSGRQDPSRIIMITMTIMIKTKALSPTLIKIIIMEDILQAM